MRISHGKGTIAGLQNVCKGAVSSRPASSDRDAPRLVGSVNIPLSAETICLQIPRHCRQTYAEGARCEGLNSALEPADDVQRASHEMT